MVKSPLILLNIKSKIMNSTNASDSSNKTQVDDKMCNSANANAYRESADKLEGRAEVRGYDFNKGLDYEKVFAAYKTTGFQSTNLGEAIDIVN